MNAPKTQQPLYRSIPVKSRSIPGENTTTRFIDLSGLKHGAKSIDESINQFYDRAASAIFNLSSRGNLDPNGVAYWPGILAKWAFGDYYNEPANSRKRDDTMDVIRTQVAGLAGTGGDYEFQLNFAIPLIYRYYADITDEKLREHIILDLMSTATRTEIFIPSSRRILSGPRDEYEDLYGRIHAGPLTIAELVETENHLLGIATVKYLTNQLLYQQEVASAQAGDSAADHANYDNNRNGDGDDPDATAVWILQALANLLRYDFQEYNARNYQIESLSAIMNLSTYAYDDRVRLAARMVLDYVSAKVAVSSNDLRRAPPFRRRNEEQYFGPLVNGILKTPLVFQDSSGENISPDPHAPDPVIGLYAQLAGNTTMLWTDEAYPYGGDSWKSGYGDSAWAEQMVHAAICDYRVPPSILDLFVNGKHRRFYQRFHHDAQNGEFADEIYAGSPSYLITAGGHPVSYCYRGDVKVPLQILIGYLSSILVGLPDTVIAAMAAEWVNGKAENLGAAMPTTFMPTGSGMDLGEIIQFGGYSADANPESFHMGVAPDFACGDYLYLPPSIGSASTGDKTVVRDGDWLFVDRSNGPDKPGYFLAILRALSHDGLVTCGCLEAYDTWAHYGTSAAMEFGAFHSAVIGANRSLKLEFGDDQINTFIMQSGQPIQFKISPHSEIVTPESSFIPPPNDHPFVGDEFAYGTVIHSVQGSAYVKIMNPNPGFETTIILDMTHPLSPVRTENGEVEVAGVPNEVWVNFDYVGPGTAGDFGDPFKTLAAAEAAVADGGVIKIVPGTTSEKQVVHHNKRVRLVAPSGGVIIGGGLKLSQNTPFAVLSRNPDQMDLFAVGLDGGLYSTWWHGRWHHWFRFSNGFFAQNTPIAALSRNPNQMDLFAVGLDGGVYNAWWNGDPWRDWTRIGGGAFAQNTPITALSRNPNQMDVFAVGLDGGVYNAWWNGDPWRDWTRIGDGAFAQNTPIAALSRNSNQMDLFAVGLNGGVYNAWWNGDPWHDWTRIGSGAFAQRTPIAALSRNSNQMDLFAVGLDGGVYSAWWNGNWNDWFRIP
jgi:hypothetical protein